VKKPESNPAGTGEKHADFEKLSEPFKALISNQGLNYQLLDMLPVPIEIFTPDGTCIFYNRAGMEMVNMKDLSRHIDIYNLKNDKVCIEIMGQKVIDDIFRGDVVSFPNFSAPIADVLDRGVIDKKPWEASTMDLFFLPIWDGDIFTCTICFFTVKNMYKGRADIIKAQKYIEDRWLDEFDLDTIARSVNLSRRHFQRIFKEITGNTPLEHYQSVKIKRIQEKLLDDSLSIEQAFEACGVDSRKTYQRLFKEQTGKTPFEYRKDSLKI